MLHPLKLMCVLAHPDDETLGTGGILAKYAAESVETYLVTATRGERGWTGHPAENPGLRELGRIREDELRNAANELRLKNLAFLDYIDGDLDQADPAEVIARIVTHIRQVRPQVVVTFGPDGAYGHPDHIAISQMTTAAVVAAADARLNDLAGQPPHRVAKLYYMAISAELGAEYESVFGKLEMTIDGVTRGGVALPNWAITTRVDARKHWQQVLAAVGCHRSQIPAYGAIEKLPPEVHQRLWGDQQFYRAFSLVNGGRKPETDLFAGLR